MGTLTRRELEVGPMNGRLDFLKRTKNTPSMDCLDLDFNFAVGI
jgi:hypothetical protein